MGFAAFLAACAAPQPRVAAPATADAAPRAEIAVPPPVGVLSFPEPPPKRIPPRPVIGLGIDQLTAALGSPDFRRSEPPGELWQYRGDDCVLDVFLLRQTNGYRVIYSAVRDRRGGATGHCTEAAAQNGQRRGTPRGMRENDRAAQVFPN